MNTVSCRLWLFFTLIVLGVALPANGDPSPAIAVTLNAPAPFGYTLGDVIVHRVSVSVEKPFELEANSLPAPGSLNDWLELRQIVWRQRQTKKSTHYELLIHYQIFAGVKESRYLTIPALPLRFHDGEKSVVSKVPAWDFAISPLIPRNTPDAEVAIRGALPPEPAPLVRQQQTLSLLLGAVLAVVLYVAWLYDRLPFFTQNPRPFTRACRTLKRLRRRSADLSTYRAALRSIHLAINETAGQTVLGQHLERFFDSAPGFTKLRARFETFFKLSRRMFYDAGAQDLPEDYPLSWLEEFCLECRKIERGVR